MDNEFQCRQITLGSTNSGALARTLKDMIRIFTAFPGGKLQGPGCTMWDTKRRVR